MIAAILLGLSAAALAPVLHRLTSRLTGWLLALIPLLMLVLVVQQAMNGMPRSSLAWSPELGIELAFALDGLSLLFVVLICGIGSLILIYTGGYMGKHAELGQLYAFLMLFMVSMFGLVLADHLITLFLFWELTSISSFLLIGFEHRRDEARGAARQALLITGGGGLAMLAGFVLLGQAAGSFTLTDVIRQGAILRAHPLYTAIVTLVLLGAFTKSAQFPFHFWLPAAMEAPTPISAYLHSATMVKAGVYLVARLTPALGGSTIWQVTITSFGAITLLAGALLALYQLDLKRILAYTTVSALGLLMMLLGTGESHAIEAAMLFLMAHALYKGALFMIAGAVDHETGTRQIERLGGLRSSMPVTTIAVSLAALSLAGFGPVLSFIAKEMALEALLGHGNFGLILVVVLLIASAVFVAESLLIVYLGFFRPAQPTPKKPHEAPASMFLGPMVLAITGVLAAVFPTMLAQSILAPAASAVLGQETTLKLTLWHGVNPALMLSIISVLLGLVIMRAWLPIRIHTTLIEHVLGWWPSRAYALGLDGLNRFARWQTSVIQHGYLRYYLATIVATTVFLGSLTFFLHEGLPNGFVWKDVRIYEVILLVLLLGAQFIAIRSQGRLSSVTALGMIGFVVTIIYVMYGAPDLAMTQILVETLTVLLFVLVFYHLPPMTRLSPASTYIRDSVLALGVGIFMTLLVLSSSALPSQSRVSPFYIENSKMLAHGSNIVNVILVDFRGLDTLGEISVLGIAAIGVYALLKLGREPER